MWKSWSKWSSEQLVLFSGQLVHLLQSGIPLVPSLAILAEQKVVSERLSEQVRKHLENGRSLSDSLKAESFPDLFVSFIRAAEEHGDYSFGFKQCEAYYRARSKFKRDLKRASTYPFMVLLLVFSAFLFLMTVVLPRFQVLYETMGIELPPMTKWMLTIFNGMNVLVWCLLGTILFAILIGITVKKQGMFWDRILFRLPIVKRYRQFRFTHYIAIQLGSLLKAGVPLLRAWELMESLSPWAYLSIQIRQMQKKVEQGFPFFQAIEETSVVFLPTFSKMIALGEASGRLAESLLHFARGTEMVIKDRMEQWTRSLEPIFIFAIGIFISITVITLFLPMLQLVKGL
ncbi:type II secretion system F family protein [Thermoflavimicrobium dichotomicum]|uniref:MSHA biogenesis protein MshG n=1 Tax=Thermoflavimicrobium dichotomicum TaxID=46223 RepID=A0A1I3NEG5_9BACL|nr:type II secretion system F family protein [Thermoflavimicrobium dichotomicum]SFJ07310.1 MSHA biogenesis protein MshG [Thermoflavimicrobium dichotomicum]